MAPSSKTVTLILVSVLCIGTTFSSNLVTNETVAQTWLNEYDKEILAITFKAVDAAWNYSTNITEHNRKIKDTNEVAAAEFEKLACENASRFDWRNFKDPKLKRMFRMVTSIGYAALNDTEKIQKYTEILSEMETIYATGNVCRSENDCLELEPGLTRLMAESSDYSELLWAWKSWRDAVGPKIKGLYTKFVKLSNEAAKSSGYKDTSEEWIAAYETETFENDIEALFKQVEPLYRNLQGYIRYRLTEIYGEKNFPKSGHIPAHILGNMWSQSWENIFEKVTPFPHEPPLDVTENMVAQNYTAERMFHLSDDFFGSLGLIKMPQAFWNKSMIVKPKDGRKVVCHASAWDFYNAVDYRVKQCTDITMNDLITVHHEMGHIEYYLQYKTQPYVFRGGANPGFHEAVGDVLALSVSTPQHLKKIGLLKNVTNSRNSELNFLFKQALDKVAFLPFGYLIDKWRWNVFKGKTSPEQYNSHWWNLRCKYQGISPPITRSESDFDPGAKYHVPDNTPYIRYFVSVIIQFQFQKALCEKAGYKGPLHTCDIFNSKAAGKALGDMLKLGSSVSWQDAMEKLTGSRKMDAQAIIEYFKPINDWLTNEQKRLKYRKFWDESCPPNADTSHLISLYVIAISLVCSCMKYI